MQRKLVVTALGAFGFGTLVGWAITADKYDKIFRQSEADLKHLSEMIKHNALRLKDQNQTSGTVHEVAMPLDENPNQISTDEIIETVADEEIENVVPDGETPEQTRSNLQEIIDNYTADPVAQQDFTNMAARSIEDDQTPPFVISRGKYAWDEDEGDKYKKITLTYFPRDRVLLDDEEDPIDDIDRMVGWRNLSQFGGESEDPDVVFIRNRRLETDFEVVKEVEMPLPLHVKYGMDKEQFRVNKAAGLIKLRQEDDDH